MARIFSILLLVLLTVPSHGGALAQENAWKALPFDKAITIVRGDGRRKIAVFSDPNCPYCKRFEEDLAKLDDVTEYVFLYPVLSQSSVRKAQAVWCAPNRAEAWLELMIYSEEPGARECEAPLEELVALGRRLGARATPTWFVETGERYQGAFALEDVRQILDRASPRR